MYEQNWHFMLFYFSMFPFILVRLFKLNTCCTLINKTMFEIQNGFTQIRPVHSLILYGSFSTQKGTQLNFFGDIKVDCCSSLFLLVYGLWFLIQYMTNLLIDVVLQYTLFLTWTSISCVPC